LNIVSINNSGQFSGKIKVNQDGRCLAIKKGDGTNGTGTGTPTDERSLWDKYKFGNHYKYNCIFSPIGIGRNFLREFRR